MLLELLLRELLLGVAAHYHVEKTERAPDVVAFGAMSVKRTETPHLCARKLHGLKWWCLASLRGEVHGGCYRKGCLGIADVVAGGAEGGTVDFVWSGLTRKNVG